MKTITLLVYMAADNNLDTAAMKDLESIRDASLYSEMDIVVQLDRWEFVDAKEGFRYHFKEGEETLIKRLGEVNSGHPDTLRAFIEESAAAYPSDKLIVVIWSHGSGTDDRDLYNPTRERFFVEEKQIEEIAIAYDDAAQEFIDNIELKKALDVSVDIDVLGFDACLMGMFEIVYQLKDQAKVMIASQDIEPPEGWPYAQILEEIKGEDSIMDIGAKVVRFYGAYYERRDSHVTQSAYDTTQIDTAAQAIDRLAKVLQEHLPDTKSLKYALAQTQTFSNSDYIDLVHFAKILEERFDNMAIQSVCVTLRQVLEPFIIANQRLGSRVENAYGISIYFPSKKNPFKETFEMYEKLDFSQDYPCWIDLIRWYYH